MECNAAVKSNHGHHGHSRRSSSWSTCSWYGYTKGRLWIHQVNHWRYHFPHVQILGSWGRKIVPCWQYNQRRTLCEVERVDFCGHCTPIYHDAPIQSKTFKVEKYPWFQWGHNLENKLNVMKFYVFTRLIRSIWEWHGVRLSHKLRIIWVRLKTGMALSTA